MLEGLAWLRDNNIAYCVTFARGLDQTEMLRRFGGDLSWALRIRPDDVEPLARLLNPDIHHPYVWLFQERLTETLRRLGDSRAELQAVELAVQNWRKTAQFKTTLSLTKIVPGAIIDKRQDTP